MRRTLLIAAALLAQLALVMSCGSDTAPPAPGPGQPITATHCTDHEHHQKDGSLLKYRTCKGDTPQ